jgi:NAD(P)-dependent dehydrogenase (short-subunit alcohol dehydrogenase family)
VLEGKVILITGGSSGIGRAAVEVFAEAGARLVVASRRAESGSDVVAAARARGGECVHVAADVAVEVDVERCVRAAIDAYGRLDGAFNNASPGGGVFKALADFTQVDFDETIAGNLRSVWLCMRAEIRAMTAGGAIVNTASVNGLGASPMGSLYSAAKAGVIALSKAGAIDYASAGIRCNAFVPGVFRTPMLEGVFRRAGGGSDAGAHAVEKAYCERIPTGRIGRPEEAARAVAWLLSDAASYVTGASMIVDGGMTSFAR